MIIRTINPSDFNFIIELAASEGIQYTEKDLIRILDYEPDGCFISLDGERRLGIVTTIVFGNLGWVGNLFVEKSARRRGAGTKLVKEALRYMQSRGVEYSKLYCYPNRITFYRRLGFVRELNIQVLKGAGRKEPFTNVQQLKSNSLNELIAFDERLFGANRSKLLLRIQEEFGSYCFAAYLHEKLVGYIMASGSGTDYEIGPWVVEPLYHERFAEDLFKAEMNRLDGANFELSTPIHNLTLESIQEKCYWQYKGLAVMMGYGKKGTIGVIEGILGIAGLDRG